MRGTWSCADGGVCSVGDTGPGGGTIYYVNNSGFTCGESRTLTCKYLEVAPPALGLANWDTDTVNSARRTWAQTLYQTTSVANFGDTTTAWAIGYGYRNTVLIINQGNSNPATSAAALAQSYRGGGYSDWFLPSRTELDTMCYWEASSSCNQAFTTHNQAAGARGFGAGYYWSSSEVSASVAWIRRFEQGGYQYSDTKSGSHVVRPIRAF